jgi:serine/threonine-protein kinase RsbW
MARKFQIEFQDMTQSQALACQLPSQVNPFAELRQSLPSHIEAISPFVDQLMRFIKTFRNRDGSEVDIEVAIREALANAIVHGNREDPEKRVYITSRCSQDGEISITIRDQGQGFDNCAVPNPTAPENIACSYGRGIYLMEELMDEVHFEECGTVVKMRKKSRSR